MHRGERAVPGRLSWFWYPLILLAAVLPLSDLAVGLVNHLLTLLLPPRVLPKLEFKGRNPGRVFHLRGDALAAGPSRQCRGSAATGLKPITWPIRLPAFGSRL